MPIMILLMHNFSAKLSDILAFLDCDLLKMVYYLKL